MPEFGKVVIFGTGLIGGSFALALKEAEAVEEVVGFRSHAVDAAGRAGTRRHRPRRHQPDP
jgi:prephenate dehydrogenase